MNLKAKLLMGFLGISVIILIAGTLGIFFIINLRNNSFEVGIKMAPLGDAAMEIKLSSTTAHLWFEEIMSGDSTVSVDEVWKLLDAAIWYSEAMLNGAENDEGKFYKLEDEEIRNKIITVKENLIKFKQVAKERHANLNLVSIGSDVDQEFDNQYEIVQGGLSKIGSARANRVMYEFANAHLFLEEFLSGDTETDPDEIIAQFENGKQIYGNTGKVLSGNITKLVDSAKIRVNNYRDNAGIESEADAKFNELFGKFITDADDAEEMIHKKMNEGKIRMEQAAWSGFFILLFAIIVSIITAAAVGIVLSFKISGSVLKVSNYAEKIADGEIDLQRLNISTRDEIGKLASSFNKMLGSLQYKLSIVNDIAQGAGDFTIDVKLASERDVFGKGLKRMIDSLNSIISQVKFATNQITSGSAQISSSSQALSQGATEQASSLEEITSSITEINSQAKTNADSANNANQIAQKAKDNAQNGNTVMIQLVNAMEKINQNSDEIKKIVKVIDDIAFQTNLLALNANVEAARAGKYGKGFAVVAEEVRNLASRSADAVKDTTSMVEESIKSIQGSNELVDKTAKQLEDIVKGAEEVVSLVNEIALASKEQAQGLDQINLGLGQIDQVTQSNTANAEESASASEELSSQAEQLKSLVSKFKLKEIEGPNKIQNLLSDSYIENTAGKEKKETKIILVDEKKKDFHNVNIDDSNFG